MGARKLYIADVFDVDSGSRTRKPFGRVFYTQSKSLIFYAFDLDRQTGSQERQCLPGLGTKETPSRAKRIARRISAFSTWTANRTGAGFFAWMIRNNWPKLTLSLLRLSRTAAARSPPASHSSMRCCEEKRIIRSARDSL